MRLAEDADLPAAYGAAHLLTRDAFVRLDLERGALVVALRPKPGVAAGARGLAAEFEAAYRDQRFRWELSRNDRSVRAQLLEQALHGPGGGPAEGSSAELDAEAEREIAALVREAERDPDPDPRRIRTPWSESRRRPP